MLLTTIIRELVTPFDQEVRHQVELKKWDCVWVKVLDRNSNIQFSVFIQINSLKVVILLPFVPLVVIYFRIVLVVMSMIYVFA